MRAHLPGDDPPEPDLNGYQEPPYEGQLDGLRAMFAKYPPGTHDDLLTLHSFTDWLLHEPNIVDGHIIWTDWLAEVSS